MLYYTQKLIVARQLSPYGALQLCGHRVEGVLDVRPIYIYSCIQTHMLYYTQKLTVARQLSPYGALQLRSHRVESVLDVRPIYICIYVYKHIFYIILKSSPWRGNFPRMAHCSSAATASRVYSMSVRERITSRCGQQARSPSRMYCKKRIKSHTQTRHTQTHDKNTTTQHTTRTTPQTNDHTKNHPSHLTTIEGGAATVRTTSQSTVKQTETYKDYSFLRRLEYCGCF